MLDHALRHLLYKMPRVGNALHCRVLYCHALLGYVCSVVIGLVLLHHDIRLTPSGMQVPQPGKTQHQPWRSFSQPGMVQSTLNREKHDESMKIYNDRSQHIVCTRSRMEQTNGSL